MKIQEIYEKYKIMPQLQLHMLRVAGVAKIICDNFQEEIDKDSIISATLLHDMGNIIKFDLKLFPEHLKPQGLEYWKKVKNDFISKYSPDEHEATYSICKELGIPKKVYLLVKSVSFSKSDVNYKDRSLSKKICAYSDHRVSPFGVTSLQERMEEGRMRFAKNKNLKDKESNEKRFNYFAGFMKKMERQIFCRTKISPEDITDREVMRLIPKLREYNI